MPEDLPPRDVKTNISSGEPDDAKVSRPVRREAAGKVPVRQLASSLPYYDNERGVMANIEVIEDPHPTDPQRPLPLVPPKVREILPELYSQEEKGMEARAVVKFFTPDSNLTWYATEFDGDDTCFGLVVGQEIELGYFSLSELEAIRGRLNLPVERDLYFEPKTLAQIKAEHQT